MSKLHGFFEGLNIASNQPTFGGQIIPDLGSFNIPSALVRHKLNNGQEWNHSAKELPRLETKYPHYSFNNGVPLTYPKDLMEELRGQASTALNLQPATLPKYPEDLRIKALAEHNEEEVYRQTERQHPPVEPPQFLKEAEEAMRMKPKYTPEQFDRLIQLGFTEEMIAKAVEEELNEDIKRVLKNPNAYTRELDTAASLDKVYESWKIRRDTAKTGTNISQGTAYANPNNYRAAGTYDENIRPLKITTGLARLRMALTESGKPAMSYTMATRETPATASLKAELEKFAAKQPAVPSYKIGGKEYKGMAQQESLFMSNLRDLEKTFTIDTSNLATTPLSEDSISGRGRGRPKGTGKPLSELAKQRRKEKTEIRKMEKEDIRR